MFSATGVRKSRSGATGGAAGMASGLKIWDTVDKPEDILYLSLLWEDMVKDLND